MMGRDMSSNMDRNMIDGEQQRYSNMMGRNMMGQVTMGRNRMGQDTMGHNRMVQDNMGRNMMGRNIYNIVSNRGMPSDVSNMMGQQMNSNMMGRDMNMMSRNMIGQDRNSQIMGRNMLGQQDITPNTMYTNVMGQPMGQNDEERDGDIKHMTNN